jgi:hypothetical protein
MSIYINAIQDAFRNAPWLTKRGPVLCSQEFDQRYGQTMHIFEYEVANGTNIPEADVPYGMFVSIQNRLNQNKARLIVAMAPLDEEGNPVFKTRCRTVKAPTALICSAKECRTFINAKSDPLPTLPSGPNIWEAYIQEYDDAHSELVVTTILSYATLTDEVPDETLREPHTVVRTLTQTKAMDAGYVWDVINNVGKFTSYEEVKCGWYIKTQETINPGTKYSMCGVVNYYWPAVLKAAPELAPVTAVREDDGTTYIAKVCVYQNVKDAYNGPCRATISVAFAREMPASCPVPTQLITDDIEYEGIIFSYALRNALHGAITVTETIANHPVLADSTRTKDFAATAYTDWPDSVLADYDVKPYKGGYLVTQVLVHKPTDPPP